MQGNYERNYYGFTLVELLVVIVVIGVLAAITIISYSGISQKAIVATLVSDLDNASRQIKMFQALDATNNYPGSNQCPNPSAGNVCLKSSSGNTFTYTVNNSANPKTFVLDVTNANGTKYRITNDTVPLAVTGGSQSTQGPLSPDVVSDVTGTYSSRILNSSDDGSVTNEGAGPFSNTLSLTSAYATMWDGSAGETLSFFRFNNVRIPKGAVINSATMTFVSSYSYTGGTGLRFYFNAEDNPIAPVDDEGFNSLTKTTASPIWSVGGWTAGNTYTSSDISSVIQELVNRTGWMPGNSMIALPVQQTTYYSQGYHAYSYDGDPSKAALLNINYSTVGTVGWTNTVNAKLSDNSYANFTGRNQLSHYLQARKFGFSIPTGSTINGIKVEVEKNTNNPAAIDYEVDLEKPDGTKSSSRADLASSWPYSDTYSSYGGSSDTWGTTWSVSDINNDNFGVVIATNARNDTNNSICNIDHVRVTIYYTPS